MTRKVTTISEDARRMLIERLLVTRAEWLGVDLEMLREAIRLQAEDRMEDLVVVEGSLASRLT